MSKKPIKINGSLLLLILLSPIIGLGMWATVTDDTKSAPAPLQKHWYAEYCYNDGRFCEYHDGNGSVCPIQVNDKDVLFSTTLRLKEGSCIVQ